MLYKKFSQSRTSEKAGQSDTSPTEHHKDPGMASSAVVLRHAVQVQALFQQMPSRG